MLGGLPDSTARGIADYVIHALELLALASILCAAVAIACLLWSRRCTPGPARALRWLAAAFGLAALAPPVFIIVAINR